MPPLYYFPSEDCCPRSKLQVQGGWSHEWCKPESVVPREVVRGPFSKPQLVCSTPFVLFNEADSGRKLGHTRTGIPDPWVEYLAQQTQGRSKLGEENVAVVDNVYRKWGVPFCQGIPDPWRNRPCFLEASFDKLPKYDNVSPCDCCKCPRKYDNIPPHHITRDYPRERDNILTCEPTNCPRKYSIAHPLNCKCTPEVSPQQFTEQLQPRLQQKTAQVLYDVNSEQICSCNLQKNVPIQPPNNQTSLKPQEYPRKCSSCPPKRREDFKPCYCKSIESKATWTQPTSPPTRSENKKKRRCPISKCFRKSKKKETSLYEAPKNNNIRNQNTHSCCQNCDCNSTPSELICTNTNIRDSGQVQVSLSCQCSHTTRTSTNDTPNNSANRPSSADFNVRNLPTILPCPFDETTDSSEKKESLDPSDTKSPQSQTKQDKIQAPGNHNLLNGDAGEHAKNHKVNTAKRRSDKTNLQGTEDETVEDERNKGR